jgi:hypothetical protein
MTAFEEYRQEFEEFVAYDGIQAISKIHICQKMTNSPSIRGVLFNSIFEKDLLLLWNKIFWIFERINEKQFLPEKQGYIKKTKGEVANFLQTHKQDSSYYLNRCSVSDNESDKLRYAFICWFLKKDPKFLVMTIKIACNVITTFLTEEKKKSIDYMLPRALLSYSYILFTLYIPNDIKLKKLIKDNARAMINDAKENNYVRGLIEPCEIICNLLDSNEHNFASEIITNLHKGAYFLSTLDDIPIADRISNCHIERSLLDSSVHFIKFLDIAERERDECRRQFHAKMAISYEREASIRELKGDDALVLANFCYLPAAKEYGLAGDNKKYNENFILFQQNNYFPPNALTEYHLTIHNPNIFEGDEDRIIESLSENDLIIPNERNITNQVNDDVKRYPLLLSFPHEKLSQHGPAGKVASTEEEIKNHLIDERMIQHIHYFENLVAQNLVKLERANRISIKGFIKFISKFSILGDNTVDLISGGLSHHFSQDYIASVHILIPQLENVLRILIKSSKVNILKEDNEVIMNKQFRGLLEIPQVGELIGIDFVNYLKIKFADIKGFNFRNDVSHGLLNVADFNNTNSYAILYSIVKLLKRYDELKKIKY